MTPHSAANCNPVAKANKPTNRPVKTLICVRTNRYFLNFTAVAALPSRITRLAIAQRLDLAADIVDFQQAEDHVDQGDQPEGQGRIDPAGDVLRLVQQPSDIEVLGPKT